MKKISLQMLLFILPLIVFGYGGATAETPGGEEGPLAVEDSLSTSVTESSLADSIIADAISYLGAPYVYGSTGPDSFDCSGLSYRVFADNGIALPRTVSALETIGEHVDRADLVPGDLIIFHNPSHVGLYIGEGEFIHCSSYLDRGVVITELSQSNYDRRYYSARRVLTGEI